MTLTPKGYRPRIADGEVDFMLKAFGAVCIEGPKWCGKTWTALSHAESAIHIGDPAGNFHNRSMAGIDPSIVLEGGSPRLIDEWQEAPPLWDAVRAAVDESTDRGRFILTGSATPNRKGVLHSGTGRIGTMRMHTMSLFESGDSSGAVSLESLMLKGTEPTSAKDSDLRTLAKLIVRGGWPGSVGLDARSSMAIASKYLDTLVRDDMYRVEGVRYSQEKVRMLLRALARNESTVASKQALLNDIAEKEEGSIDIDTISTYLDVLKRLFITEDLPAFSTNLRSSSRVGKTLKRHFTDPSLAAAALNATPETLINDLRTFGFLFESLCVRDLTIYSGSFGGSLRHYLDYDGREIDAVVQHPNGRWGAFEIRLGANRIDEAAEKLLDFRSRLGKEAAGTLSALCVICGTSGYAYAREDGVAVVPITALRE